MTPHTWINNFSAEMEGKMPNPFVFSVMLANNFNGKVFVCEDDFIVRINGEFYDFNGCIDSEDLDLDEYVILDKLSLLDNVKMYHYIKWWFINPFVEDELYHINMN
jgi:hypothetical protein